jgi:hypothetical protein
VLNPGGSSFVSEYDPLSGRAQKNRRGNRTTNELFTLLNKISHLAARPKARPVRIERQLLGDNPWNMEEKIMGRGILLWLLGVPIPIIILLALVWH